MISNFIAFDFETSFGHIPCSIGIVHFINGEPISEYYALIKPIDLKFSPINSRINRIKLEDVLNEREFHEIWSEIEHFFNGQNIVAHNASTDISILEKTLKYYGISNPTYKCYCTLNIAKEALALENYKLSTLANHFNIKQKEYHNALDDAYVCGNLFKQIQHLAYGNEYTKSKHKIKNNNQSAIKNIDKLKLSEAVSWKFDGYSFLFTGKLSLFTRDEAEEMVENHGGKNISAVSKNLNYLVVGEKAGSKLKKAQEIGTIEILDEQQFLDLLAEN